MDSLKIRRASNFTLQRTKGSRCSPPAAERERSALQGFECAGQFIT